MVKKKYNYACYSKAFLYIGSALLLFAILYAFVFFVNYVIFAIFDPIALQWMLGFFSGGVGILSIGIAFHSADIANKSDEKMQDLVNLNFVEKQAIIQEHKNYIKVGSFDPNCFEQCILDLEAALEVKNWPSEERINKYIDDLEEFTTDVITSEKIPNEYKVKLISIIDKTPISGHKKEKKLKDYKQQLAELKVKAVLKNE